MPKLKTVERARRMTAADVKHITLELAKWELGQLGSKLTWAILEDRFGFSRQSLQAKQEIKAAYLSAKMALSGGLVKTKEKVAQDNEKLMIEISRLKIQLAEYKKTEEIWMRRWQRIAYHLREKGASISMVDKPAPSGERMPSGKQTSNILRPFDKEIPPSGRV